jgi:hypothetical protein
MNYSQIPELELTSVSQLAVLVEKYGDTADLLFRGQSAAYPRLTTTIERLEESQFDEGERAPAVFGHLGSQLSGYENYALGEFKKRAKDYVMDLPDLNDDFSWLALMQHHGAPTRLLDVTKSVFVALYFATAHLDKSDGVIYAMFTPTYAYSVKGYGDERIRSILVAHSDDEIGNKFVRLQGQYRGLIDIKNYRPSKREIAQQGLFLLPLATDQSFETNMSALYDAMEPSWSLPSTKLTDLEIGSHSDCPVIKFRIPRKCFRSVHVALQHMNLTASSLFPDFEGLNKSMIEVMRSARYGMYRY